MPVDLVVRVESKTQGKRILTMRSASTTLAVAMLIFAMGTSQVGAQNPPANSGESPFSQLRGFGTEASYSGYIGDDSDLVPPSGLPSATPAYWQDSSAAQASEYRRSVKGDGKGAAGKRGQADGQYVFSPWVSVEYMHTWLQGRHLPPLVTTSPPGVDGILPGARILFGGDDVDGGVQAGGKLSFGGWLDPNERLGVGGRLFGVQTETIGFHAASNANGNPVLARPIWETWPASGGPGPASFVVAGQETFGPQVFTLAGDISAVTHTDVLGAEAYLRYLLYCAPGRRLDLVGGYQFTRIDDSLGISHTTDFTPAIFARRLAVEDVFSTENKFHGGTLGLLGEIGQGPVTLSVLAKVGMGNMNEVVSIAGRSVLTDAGGNNAIYNGGVLALPTNIGVYEQDKFAVIPEAEIKLTFRLTPNAELTLGYDLMYWSSLALAGEQIETGPNGLPMVNSSQWLGQPLDPSGGNHPGFAGITDSSLWLQGLTVGVTLRL